MYFHCFLSCHAHSYESWRRLYCQMFQSFKRSPRICWQLFMLLLYHLCHTTVTCVFQMSTGSRQRTRYGELPIATFRYTCTIRGFRYFRQHFSISTNLDQDPQVLLQIPLSIHPSWGVSLALQLL